MKRLSEQTLYEILEIAVDAAPAQIEEAVERAVALYGPGSLATYTLMSPDEAALLTSRIEEARTVLLDPDARARYDERLPGSAPEAERAEAAPLADAADAAPIAWPLPPVVIPAVAPPPPASDGELAGAGEPGGEPAPAADEPVDPERPPDPQPVASDRPPLGVAPPPPPEEVSEPTAAVAPPPPPEEVSEPTAAVAPPPPDEEASEPTAAVAPPQPADEVAEPTVAVAAPPDDAPQPAAEVPQPAAEIPGAAAVAAPSADAAPPVAPSEPPEAAPVRPPAIRLARPAAVPAPIRLVREVVAPPPPAAAPPDDLVPEGNAWTGDALRRVREARGITLDQISVRTRVTRHHVENIEAERFALLPAPVYLRGILMSLARELRLDGQKVARAYLERAEGKGPPP